MWVLINALYLCWFSLTNEVFDFFLMYWHWTTFSFSFISGLSGTSLFNSVSLMAYNVFYTSIPVLVSTIDKDLSEGTVMQHPQILFYCQAGRYAAFFFVGGGWGELEFTATCILLLNLLTIVLETGCLILAHLPDGLAGPCSMWVMSFITYHFLSPRYIELRMSLSIYQAVIIPSLWCKTHIVELIVYDSIFRYKFGNSSENPAEWNQTANIIWNEVLLWSSMILEKRSVYFLVFLVEGLCRRRDLRVSGTLLLVKAYDEDTIV